MIRISSEEILGWASSFLLVFTMLMQVKKQWAERSSTGVSKWLYFGQLAAETGFFIYSVLLKNWVFAFTNAVLVLLNLIGAVLLIRHRGWSRAFSRES